MTNRPFPRLALFLPDLDQQPGRPALISLANAALDDGWSVDVMAPMGGGVLRSTLDRRIGQIDLNRRHVTSSLGTLARALAERRPNLVIAGEDWPGLIAACALRLARQRSPLWVATHTTRDPDRPGRTARLLHRMDARLMAADQVTISECLKAARTLLDSK